jgi:hypothetical protein
VAQQRGQSIPEQPGAGPVQFFANPVPVVDDEDPQRRAVGGGRVVQYA